jgi:hypothetical protein
LTSAYQALAAVKRISVNSDFLDFGCQNLGHQRAHMASKPVSGSIWEIISKTAASTRTEAEILVSRYANIGSCPQSGEFVDRVGERPATHRLSKA